MSTSLEVFLESLDLNNYMSLAIVTAVVYDYALTFSSEIEHIWKRRWTWVSSAFLLVRYCGLLSIITTALTGSSFVHGPLWICKMFYYVSAWTLLLFTNAADLMMIFRVYALYGQSRKILAFLLFIYSGEVITSAINTVVYTEPGNASMTLAPAPFPSVCVLQYASWNWGRYYVIPQIVLQGVMCLLAIYQCLGQSLQLYKATKRWQFNQYFQLLVNQGLLYFLINFFHAIIMQDLFSMDFGQTLNLILSPATDILIFTLNPWFILSIRELYAHTVQGQYLDTGFGTLSGHHIGMMTNIGTRLRFADVGTRTGESPVGIEEIPMEVTRAKRYVDRVNLGK